MIFAILFGLGLGFIKFNPMEDFVDLFMSGNAAWNMPIFKNLILFPLLVLGVLAINDVSFWNVVQGTHEKHLAFDLDIAFRNMMISAFAYCVGLIMPLLFQRGQGF